MAGAKREGAAARAARLASAGDSPSGMAGAKREGTAARAARLAPSAAAGSWPVRREHDELSSLSLGELAAGSVGPLASAEARLALSVAPDGMADARKEGAA